MKRESFGSRLGFILVSAGCAIGIGNVWKFPYICGAYGGAAFILIYLCFLVILGIPVLVAEFAVGRGSHTSVAKCFDKLAPAGSCWKPLKSTTSMKVKYSPRQMTGIILTRPNSRFRLYAVQRIWAKHCVVSTKALP